MLSRLDTVPERDANSGDVIGGTAGDPSRTSVPHLQAVASLERFADPRKDDPR